MPVAELAEADRRLAELQAQAEMVADAATSLKVMITTETRDALNAYQEQAASALDELAIYRARVEETVASVAETLVSDLEVTMRDVAARQAEAMVAAFRGIPSAAVTTNEKSKPRSGFAFRASPAESAAVLSDAENRANSLREEADRYAEEQRARADREYAERKVREENEFKARRAKQEEHLARQKEEQRQESIAAQERYAAILASKIRTVIALHTEKGVNGDLAALAAALEGEFRQVQSMELESGEATVKKRYKFDPVALESVRSYWLKMAMGVVASAAIIWTYTANPEIKAKLKSITDFKSTGQDTYVAKVVEERRKSSIYAPPQTFELKDSYTDNVLFTQGYIQTEMDESNQKKWILAVNTFIVQDLDLSDKLVAQFIPLEKGLIRKLVELRAEITPQFEQQGISRLREVEKEATTKILALFDQDTAAYERLMTFKKTFLKANRVHFKPTLKGR
ncbi:MAG TPA: hypothetical protein VE954_18715 [Oligoflexus sp.]|uniref:hypothetical protein n=1 Tax=Oligoflexus sp. TaxID=1971216 RepID=UPI002D227A25|nr:hypothetical protein [Oligoflexus sp.]HYX35134.1 hypothetical protein [Oligoflexus sp.]